MTNYQKFSSLLSFLEKYNYLRIESASADLPFLFHLCFLPSKIHQVPLMTLMRPEFLDVVVVECVPDKSFKTQTTELLSQINDSSWSLP